MKQSAGTFHSTVGIPRHSPNDRSRQYGRTDCRSQHCLVRYHSSGSAARSVAEATKFAAAVFQPKRGRFVTDEWPVAAYEPSHFGMEPNRPVPIPFRCSQLHIGRNYLMLAEMNRRQFSASRGPQATAATVCETRCKIVSADLPRYTHCRSLRSRLRSANCRPGIGMPAILMVRTVRSRRAGADGNDGLGQGAPG